MYNAAYVTSPTLDIIPPQMLINNLSTKDNLDVDYEKHDNTYYIISFKNKRLWIPYRLLTIPIGLNGLFHLWTTTLCTSFYARASTFQCYECYAGDHLITDSDEYSDIEILNPSYQ